MSILHYTKDPLRVKMFLNFSYFQQHLNYSELIISSVVVEKYY